MMKNRPTDNLIKYLEDLVDQVRTADDEQKSCALLQQAASEIRECINADRIEAAGRLAAWLAHKINNPLGAISGNAQLLSRRLTRDISDETVLQSYTKYTDGILSQTERCAAITGDLLMFTKPFDADIKPVELKASVLEAVELAEYGRGSGLVQLCEGLDKVKVLADKELLTRVLYEVIVNAIQASPENVKVSACLDENAGWVRISVEDAGEGIADSVLPRVFDPFFSTREKARGLGLTTSLAIMKRLGGCIEVTSTGPSGTVVTIQLPTECGQA